MFRVHYALCNVQCAVCSVQCAVCSVYFAVCTVQYLEEYEEVGADLDAGRTPAPPAPAEEEKNKWNVSQSIAVIQV